MSKKTIIIGGGVAGLSAGIYGQLNDYDTEILEMHTSPGGQCTAWKRKDYIFDYCIHWLVGSSHGPFHTIWRETGALDDATRVVNMETYVTIITETGEKLFFYSDIDRWERYLTELAPEDGDSISRMCKDMRRVSTLKMVEKALNQRNIFHTIRFFLSNGPVIRVFAKLGRHTV